MKFNCGDFFYLTFLGFALHIIILSAILSVEAGKKCPGKCMSNVTDCKSKGGKITGYCTNELPCCDYTYMKIGTCDAVKSKLITAIFRNPEYPNLGSGDLTCIFEFVLSPNATGILVDFTHVVMDGVGFVKDSPCESDMFIFKGFPDWTPPAQCGNLTNYVAVIDLGNNRTRGMKSFKIVALMSGNKYRWSIKVTQTFEKKFEKSIRTTTTPPASIDNYPSPDDDFIDTFPVEYNMSPPSDETEINLEEIVGVMQTFNIDKSYFIGGHRPNLVFNDLPGSSLEYNNELDNVPFIVNGEEIDVSKTPWQASLRTIVSPRLAEQLPKLKLKNCTISEGIHFCGASIISPRLLLSACHCFSGTTKFRTWKNLQTVKVVLGDSNLCDEKTDGVQEFRLEKVYYHYGYDSKVILHDMVVIQLDKDIKFTEKVQKIKLAEHGTTIEHVEAIASGWGLTNLTIGLDAKTPDQLQSADDMFIGNLSECIENQKHLFGISLEKLIWKYPKYENVYDSLICTYVRNISVPRVVGQGDSGGSLVWIPNNHEESDKVEPTLIGVISYMIPIPHDEDGHDVSKYVDFYQSVSFYRKWIDLIVQNFKLKSVK